MIYYNQDQRYFKYKSLINYSPFIKINFATIFVIFISYLQIIDNKNTFGTGTMLNVAPQIFISISLTILIGVNLTFVYMLIRQKEIHADLNQGLIFIYKKNFFSERKLIKKKPLNEYYCADVKLLAKTKKNLILLRKKNGNISFIIGQYSLNNSENFNPDTFLQDLEFYFSNNNGLGILNT